jgi:hypothetical protein
MSPTVLATRQHSAERLGSGTRRLLWHEMASKPPSMYASTLTVPTQGRSSTL